MRVHVPVPEMSAGTRRPLGFTRDIVRIGVVDDNLDPPFMHELVAQLRTAHPAAEVKVWVKEPGTAPAPDWLIAEMADEVQVAVVGVGM